MGTKLVRQPCLQINYNFLSKWKRVWGGGLPGSFLALATSIIVINENTLIKFAAGTKLRWAARMVKDRIKMQIDGDKVDKSECNSMRAKINF